MGISAQQLLQSDPEYLQRQLAQQEMQRLNPTGSAAGAIGALLGRGVSNLAGGRGFFDVNDAGLRRVADVQRIMSSTQFDPNNPVKYYEDIASSLQQAGYGDLAPMAFQEAAKFRKEEKLTTVAPGAVVLNRKGEVVFTAPDRDQMVKTPADFAAAGRELGFGVRPNIGEYSQAETTAINNLIEGRKVRIAGAGVPASGEVKITDIATAQAVVDRYVKDPKDKLTTVNNAKTQLALAFRGEGAALPQLQRQLVKLVGDSQIGQGEVRDALGSAGIVSDTISAVNKFMTGVPTQDKLKSVEQVINALEDINAKSFNQGRKQAEQVVGEAKFSESTRKTLIPPAYKTGREKTAESLKGQDKQAYDWAKANPTDSRSTAILNRLGVQ